MQVAQATSSGRAAARPDPARVDRLWADLAGAGPLQPLLEDPSVTDILVNGPGPVWVDAGNGLGARDVGLNDESALRALAVRLAAASGRRLDEATPFVDARLPGGARLHAVLAPISPVGTLISIRVPRARPFTMDELVASGTVPARWAPVLADIVRQRLGFLVSGGTGTGKTTVLSTLLSLADPSERVLIVEDAVELRPGLPHVVHLEARHPNNEGAGEVTLTDLVRQALRMRPDRLVVGECRGAEVRDLLAAMNTGHEGGCGTIHANNATDVPARLEALGSLAGLGRSAVAAQAASALDVVVALRREGHRRVVAQLGLVTRGRHGLDVLPALSRDAVREWVPGPGWELLQRRLEGCDPLGDGNRDEPGCGHGA
ncbi:MAG: pilus assembly protein CpaF [Micrococcales bacterium]|nr:MAG: pilus assembly protein CpaF [Micrococcales bacterium]